MNRPHRLAPAIAFALIAPAALAQGAQPNVAQAIEFPNGQSTAIVEGDAAVSGALAAGRADGNGRTYLLHAKAGQQLAMRIDSYGRHVRFSLIKPSPSMVHYAFVEKGANVTEWTGRLAQTGDYVVSVFTHANTRDPHFRLHVSLR